jgi:hypothetical protein
MVGIVLCRYQASMMGRLGVRKRGVVGRLRKQQPGVLPTVSGDKVDKRNISCYDQSLYVQLRKR